MWVQLILSKLQDMTFVAAEDQNWPVGWQYACTGASTRKERNRYSDVLVPYAALHEMRRANTFGRGTLALEISRRHKFVKRENVETTMDAFWELFLESSEDSQPNLVWPDALMEKIDDVYQSYFPDGWVFKTEETGEDGETIVNDKWRESVKGYYQDVTELVSMVWETARDQVPKEEDETRWATFDNALTKWKWVRGWSSVNPYYDFPLPTRTFIHHAFEQFVKLEDAFGWVSTFLSV